MSLVVRATESAMYLQRGLASTVLHRMATDDLPATDDLIAFTRRMFSLYRPARHHDLIAAALERVEAGDETRLIVTMPPRHGKSTLASEHFPPWFLGRNPERRVIACSHTQSLANHFSRRARNIVASPRYPFPIRIASDLAAIQSWDIQGHRGGYIAAGVGGAITGLGADLLLIDDPVKSAEEADSATYRETAWEWFTQTATPRLEPGGRVVVIGTRWHEDDLIGRLLQTGRWTVLHLPALAEEGDPLGRAVDEPLWPERFDAAALDLRRVEVGTRAWEAQYQGRPAPAEGAILKREWWDYYDVLPTLDGVYQFWDTAFKAGQQNDYSVGATWGVAGDGYYVRDLWRERVAFPDLKRAVIAQATRWSPRGIYVEDQASGQSLIQELQRETRLPIIPFKTDRDKVARVNAVSPYVEAGKVRLPASAPWLGDFVEEHAAFPFGQHDDIVDTTSMALLQLAHGGEFAPVDPRTAQLLTDFVEGW